MPTELLFIIVAGIDWGSQFHQICILNRKGHVLGEKMFPHSGEGIHQMLDWLINTAGCAPEEIAVNIEVPNGPIVDSLLERGIRVFSINPKQLDRFRDRFSPAGAKDDRRDARVLADALRTDPACLRALNPLDANIVQLREWSRMSDELTAQRTRLTHQIRDHLWRYFPQFMKLGFPLHSPVIWVLWSLIPTPVRARRVRLASVQKVLKKHRIRRLSAEQVLQCLRTEPLTAAAGVVEAATARIRLAIAQLRLLEQQLREVNHAMETILASLDMDESSSNLDESGAPEASTAAGTPSSSGNELNDVEILSSMPGVGTKVLATLISEASPLLNARDYRGLRCLCGVAPVTKRSGKSWRVVRRRACLRRLVNALYHWSRVAVQHDPISKAKYKALRGRGHSHGRALRSVADRLLAIACAMLRDGTRFDPSRPTAEA